MTQFAFLAHEWPAVLEAAGRAEAAVRPDPRTAWLRPRHAAFKIWSTRLCITP